MGVFYCSGTLYCTKLAAPFNKKGPKGPFSLCASAFVSLVGVKSTVLQAPLFLHTAGKARVMCNN